MASQYNVNVPSSWHLCDLDLSAKEALSAAVAGRFIKYVITKTQPLRVHHSCRTVIQMQTKNRDYKSNRTNQMPATSFVPVGAWPF